MQEAAEQLQPGKPFSSSSQWNRGGVKQEVLPSRPTPSSRSFCPLPERLCLSLSVCLFGSSLSLPASYSLPLGPCLFAFFLYARAETCRTRWFAQAAQGPLSILPSLVLRALPRPSIRARCGQAAHLPAQALPVR